MDALVRLVHLPGMHANLLWDTIIPATVAVFADLGAPAPHPLLLTVQAVPGFGSQEIRLLIDPHGVSPELIAKVRRTYESQRRRHSARLAIGSCYRWGPSVYGELVGTRASDRLRTFIHPSGSRFFKFVG
jgi:hypothetical protein